MRFSMLFESIMEKQMVLKQIMTLDEWVEIKDHIRYDFMEDNHFTELKENEIMTGPSFKGQWGWGKTITHNDGTSSKVENSQGSLKSLCIA